MASAARKERIDMRVDSDTKRLAEQASTAAGYSSLTDFITHLIRENAPRILKQKTVIELANNQFDQFMAACMGEAVAPSTRIMEAAQRLDQEGF